MKCPLSGATRLMTLNLTDPNLNKSICEVKTHLLNVSSFAVIIVCAGNIFPVSLLYVGRNNSY